jgi:hypothetical protein
VSNEQITSIKQHVVQFIRQGFLGPFIKVDHHVSAKYHVKGIFEGKWLDEIKAPESNYVTQ